MKLMLQFLGAAGTVTGSRYLVSFGATHVLIDCGLFQGVKNLRLRNWTPLPFPAAEIDAGILTRAHLDHGGYLPRFINEFLSRKTRLIFLKYLRIPPSLLEPDIDLDHGRVFLAV